VQASRSEAVIWAAHSKDSQVRELPVRLPDLIGNACPGGWHRNAALRRPRDARVTADARTGGTNGHLFYYRKSTFNHGAISSSLDARNAISTLCNKRNSYVRITFDNLVAFALSPCFQRVSHACVMRECEHGQTVYPGTAGWATAERCGRSCGFKAYDACERGSGGQAKRSSSPASSTRQAANSRKIKAANSTNPAAKRTPTRQTKDSKQPVIANSSNSGPAYCDSSTGKCTPARSVAPPKPAPSQSDSSSCGPLEPGATAVHECSSRTPSSPPSSGTNNAGPQHNAANPPKPAAPVPTPRVAPWFDIFMPEAAEAQTNELPPGNLARSTQSGASARRAEPSDSQDTRACGPINPKNGDPCVEAGKITSEDLGKSGTKYHWKFSNSCTQNISIILGGGRPGIPPGGT